MSQEKGVCYMEFVGPVFDRMKFCFNQTAFNSFSGKKNPKQNKTKSVF